MADISCNLPLPLLKRLEEEKKSSSSSITAIVQEALTLYFMAKDREKLAPVLDPLRYYQLSPAEPTPEPPTPYMQNGVIVTKGLQKGLQELIDAEPKGLIMPEMKNDPSLVRERIRPTVRPGDGVVQRLKAIGVDPKEVILARRAKAAGREYNKELEQYFGLIV
jgi:hypothetical protein